MTAGGAPLAARRLPNADALLERAGGFLSAREAEHNLLLGIAGSFAGHDEPHDGEPPWFAVAELGGSVAAVAMRTPPHNVVLSEVDDLAAVDELAALALADFGTLPGVLGPKQASARFAACWERLTGLRGRVSRAERIHRADAAAVPDGVPGRRRPWLESDRATAVAWLSAFGVEALDEETTAAEAETWLDRRLAQPRSGIVLWEDGGEPVSLAGYGGPTGTGIRIGPVYTPPARRRRGYAEALVARVTADRLRDGYAHCFLFTDLANATSNALYHRIGYRPVADVDEWAFDVS